MAEIINFTTRERYITEDDEELLATGLDLAILMSRIEHLGRTLADVEQLEDSNVIPFNREKFVQRKLMLTASLAERMREKAELQRRLASLCKKLPGGIMGDASPIPLEFL